jgi:hypothetical protein
MLELRLGCVDLAGGQHAADLLGESARTVPAGRFDVVGRLDPRSKRFRSGALVRNLGNDQWFVHLINVQQLARLAQVELRAVEVGSGDAQSPAESLAQKAAVGMAIHAALGPGAALTAPILETATVALRALVGETSPQADRIARELFAKGVQPESKGDVRRSVSRLKTDALETDRSYEPLSLEIER